MELDIGFAREKENAFEVGYYSSVAIAILDEEKELIGFHNIPIWKCEKNLFRNANSIKHFGE